MHSNTPAKILPRIERQRWHTAITWPQFAILLVLHLVSHSIHISTSFTFQSNDIDVLMFWLQYLGLWTPNVLYSSMSLTGGLSVSNEAAMVEFDFKLNERQENGSICTVFSVRAWNLLNDCYYRCCDCNYDCFHLFRRVLFFFSSIFHFTNQLQLVMIKITAITLQLRFHFIFAVNHFISQNIPFIDHQR